MPYPEALVTPMRAELTRLGVQELRDAESVDQALSDAVDETVLLVINSVCGCAAANARPAVALSMHSMTVGPDRFVTVFAGQDIEATARARSYLAGIPPSSPFIALLKKKEPVFVLERRHIEGRSASAIASDLTNAFEAHCRKNSTTPSSTGGSETSKPVEESDLPDTFRSIL